ncbi:MAG: hypothetical protein E5W94_28965 [Mesorhizobium sp.]|nr:MAG: hypothetical protein E5W94_28965 [Mesorhizobium sp.]
MNKIFIGHSIWTAILLPIWPDDVGASILKEEKHTRFFTHASVYVHFSARLAHIGSRKQARVPALTPRAFMNPGAFDQYTVEITTMGMKT